MGPASLCKFDSYKMHIYNEYLQINSKRCMEGYYENNTEGNHRFKSEFASCI